MARLIIKGTGPANAEPTLPTGCCGYFRLRDGRTGYIMEAEISASLKGLNQARLTGVVGPLMFEVSDIERIERAAVKVKGSISMTADAFKDAIAPMDGFGKAMKDAAAALGDAERKRREKEERAALFARVEKEARSELVTSERERLQDARRRAIDNGTYDHAKRGFWLRTEFSTGPDRAKREFITDADPRLLW